MPEPIHKIVSREEWHSVREEILKKEKEFTRARDKLTAEIRDMPWTKIDKGYFFDTPHGKKSLSDLFEDKSQLFVVHLMFDPKWNEACQSCSFWADSYDGLRYHLPQRDVSFKVISHAPLEKILEYKKRLGWKFDWVSAYDGDFNLDFGWSSDGQTDDTKLTEKPGFSVFYKEGGDVYQTYYSTWRGLEVLNPVYAALDLVPKGRDEKGLPWPMAWVKRHDEY